MPCLSPVLLVVSGLCLPPAISNAIRQPNAPQLAPDPNAQRRSNRGAAVRYGFVSPGRFGRSGGSARPCVAHTEGRRYAFASHVAGGTGRVCRRLRGTFHSRRRHPLIGPLPLVAPRLRRITLPHCRLRTRGRLLQPARGVGGRPAPAFSSNRPSYLPHLTIAMSVVRRDRGGGASTIRRRRGREG